MTARGTRRRAGNRPPSLHPSGKERISSRRRAALWLALGIVVVAAAAVAALTSGDGERGDAAPAASMVPDPERLVRPNSRRLSQPAQARAVLVEFLDPECEACRAASPAVDHLVEQFGDRVEVVVRYFPLHANSNEAARAAEAAGDQGRFGDMLAMLFDTQAEWGETQTSQREAFFAMARDLGLDMDRFTQAYDEPATQARVDADLADARALGLSGTPSFFLDGQPLRPSNVADLNQEVIDPPDSPE